MTNRLGPLQIMATSAFSSAGLCHGFTTTCGEPGAALARTRDVEALRVAAAFGEARTLKQVHGTEVVRAEEVANGHEADAVITGRTDLLLTIQTADCVPLLLHDRRTGALAAVHAGWRGTAKRIAAATLEAMARAYDTRANDVSALIGPAIGPCCFEVGDEVLQALERATLGAGARAGTTAKNRPTVDLWRANALALREAGVGAESIHTLALCTHCRVDLFPSYRRGDTGRMYAFVGRLS